MKRVCLIGLMLVCGGCLMGCVSAGQGSPVADQTAALDANLGVLKDAKFKGSVRYQSNGSPFGFGMHNVNFFSIGPREVGLTVEGQVDFAEDGNAD